MLTTSSASFPGSAHREPVSAPWQRAADHCLLLSLGFTNYLLSVSVAFNPSQINSCLDEILFSVWPVPAQPAWGWFAFIPSGLCVIKQSFIEFTVELCLERVFCWYLLCETHRETLQKPRLICKRNRLQVREPNAKFALCSPG